MARSEYPSRKSLKLAASHQRSWLWGRNAVVETLTAGRWPVVELLVSQDLEPTQFDVVASVAAQQGLQIQQVSSDRIAELCQATDHQGHLLRLGPFPCGTPNDLRTRLQQQDSDRRFPPLYVICDRIQDAHNFGAILRSCEAMAADGVIIGTTHQCRITPHVARSSSGAINHLNLFQVDDLTNAVGDLKAANIHVIAASEKSDRSLWDTQLQGPLAIIIGAEATGILPELLASTDGAVSIPMLGRGTSLNAAVAAGILLTEIRRQQHTASTIRTPEGK